MSVILGIDPGSRICGYGLIRARGNSLEYLASGVIRMGTLTFPERLHTIFSDISDIIIEHGPDVAAVEEVFMGKNASSALKLGQARGAAIVACTHYQLPVAEYAARKVKQALVGRGQADKKQVQQMVKSLLGLSRMPPEDAADALAIAVCHANTQNTLIRMADVKTGRRGRLQAT
ncbi:MAG: crossover junction endodeoxyribonuclease RuvC [Pseudohongiellaceae bacterium]|jgi:crossover junction endodeoxyribonuclease RuvC